MRANRIIDYGPTWKNVLRHQWADSNITLRQMAKTLGVDPKTVKQRAAELSLHFPRKGPGSVTNRGPCTAPKCDKAKRLELHRCAWIELQRLNPASGTKDLRSHAPALYSWLYRNDRLWLKDHQPARIRSTVSRVHVDWAKRDEEFVGRIATVAAQIRNQPGQPQRITTMTIGRALGTLSLFETALAKLPLTRSVIKSVVESGEDFAVRRVHAAAQKLRQTAGAFSRRNLVRTAGLHYQLEHQPRLQAAVDYEMRPFVSIHILRDTDSVPRGQSPRSFTDEFVAAGPDATCSLDHSMKIIAAGNPIRSARTSK
jgi:hypothetical protein